MVAHIVLLTVVFVSALCMYNKCLIGEVVQSVAHGPSVDLLIGRHTSKG